IIAPLLCALIACEWLRLSRRARSVALAAGLAPPAGRLLPPRAGGRGARAPAPAACDRTPRPRGPSVPQPAGATALDLLQPPPGTAAGPAPSQRSRNRAQPLARTGQVSGEDRRRWPAPSLRRRPASAPGDDPLARRSHGLRPPPDVAVGPGIDGAEHRDSPRVDTAGTARHRGAARRVASRARDAASGRRGAHLRGPVDPRPLPRLRDGRSRREEQPRRLLAVGGVERPRRNAKF